MRVLLIDDEEIALIGSEVMLKELDDVEVVGKYTNPYLALEQIEVLDVDVVFLDMEMGEVHGLELAEVMMSKYKHLEILFVTAHPRYALEAFEVNAIDYLLKPLNKKRLKKAIEKTQEKLALYSESKKRSVSKEVVSFYAKTLGNFHLLDNTGKAVKWRTKKVKELFLFFLHHQGVPVHKAIVMEQLWPDIHLEKAVTLLHTTVYQLRKTFKENGMENAVQFNNDHYAWSVSIESDYTVLKGLLSTNMDSTKVEQILALYTGDFLEEEDFRWAFPIQEGLKQSVLQYLEQLISISEVNPLLTEKCLLKILEIDCYNEAYMYKLLALYAQMKNTQKMKELYKTIEARLRDDLGVGIPYEMKELYAYMIEK